MNYRIAVSSVFVGIAIVSFCIGQGKPTVKSQVTSDVKMSDHDSIEKLQVEVTGLQKRLAALTQKYDTHTHQLRNLKFAQLPGSIECNQTIVQGSAVGTYRESVDKVCRQIVIGNISVLVQGNDSLVTGSPSP